MMAVQNEDVVIPNKEKRTEDRLTALVTFAALAVSCTSFGIGYDFVVAGGVAATNSFLKEFFPDILNGQDKNNYCHYDNQRLQSFVSSLYLATFLGSLSAAYLSHVWGRRRSMLVGGFLFMIGTASQAGAQNLAMLIVGRVVQGCGLGMANQASYLYAAEVSPASSRGKLMATKQLWYALGNFCAAVANWQSAKIIPWGWRLSLGLVALLSLMWTIAAMLLPDSPSSLLQRGHIDEARRILQRFRGTTDVDAEFEDVKEAVNRASLSKDPFILFRNPRYRPQLIICPLLGLFFQATGAYPMSFYAPVLFRSLRFTVDAALCSTMVIGGVKLAATLVAFPIVDRYGRKVLLYSGGVQVFICLITMGALLQYHYSTYGSLSNGAAVGVVIAICLFVAGISYSWGTMNVIISTEICPLEIRSVGVGLSSSVVELTIFVFAHTFLSMLCEMRYGVFYFFATWVFIMTAFAAAFVPETKNIGMERATELFEGHWFWGRVIGTGSDVCPSHPEDQL